MGTEKQRKKILNQIKNTFVDAARRGLGLDKSKVISGICMEHGVTKRKASEYIQVLLDSGFIVEDMDSLWLADKFKVPSLTEEADKVLNST